MLKLKSYEGKRNTNMKQRVENLNKNSLTKAFRRLKKDTKGFSSLIVRDSLDYLDFEVNIDSNLGSLVFEINSSNYHPQRPYLHLSAKSKGINRPSVVFDVRDALVYRFCVEQIEDQLLEKTRQKNIRGGIKITPNRNNNGDDFYERWFQDWKEHQDAVRASLTKKKYLVATDIASYFENINILVLKDLVRGDITGKNCVLNLLFYFLESTRFRYDYEVNTFNGLPQENIDCSRILAYYFLNSHDQTMGEFCKKYDSDFYRFVDDMSIAVNTETEGKWALKQMAESLRKLNLVSSIEKTSILESDKAKEELFFDENDKLTELESELKDKLRLGKGTEQIIEKIKKYYNQLIEAKKDSYKNWSKVLKRFYSLFTYAKSDFFFNKLIEHFKKYPLLFSDNRIVKYLLQNKGSTKFNETIDIVIDYLYSKENLYPAVETNLIETLLAVCSNSQKTKLEKLGSDIFFSKNGYKSLSDYARTLSCLLVFKFDNGNVDKIANHYLNANENDNILRKYLVFVSLTVNNQSKRQKILEKARKEQNLSINRLVNFIENISIYKDFKVVKDYIKKNKIVILFDKDMELKIEHNFTSVRSEILKKIIEIYQ